MGKIKSFEDFSRSMSIQEADGFGTMPYLEKRDGSVYLTKVEVIKKYHSFYGDKLGRLGLHLKAHRHK